MSMNNQLLIEQLVLADEEEHYQSRSYPVVQQREIYRENIDRKNKTNHQPYFLGSFKPMEIICKIKESNGTRRISGVEYS